MPIAANDSTPGPARARRALHVLMVLATLALIAFALFFAHTAAAAERSAKAKSDFRAKHPCPATGKSSGACPGYVIDHIKPLCAGGPDRPSNMQWQTVAAAKVKDREERKMCSQHAASPAPKAVKASAKANDSKCGSRGGPGYRTASGRCASWHD